MNLSLPWQPPMGSRRKPPVASYFMCRSRVDSQKRHGTGPAPPTEARCRPESRESWRMRVAPTSPSTFPCLPLPCAESAGTGKGGRWSTVRCWSPRHTTSIAEEGGTTTGRTWRGGGKKAASRTDRGLAQALHLHSRQKRGGFPSPEQEVCAHLVTREPSSSWAVCTSQPCAFQQEVASSDLGGTRPKGGTPLGSRREGDRGTPGPLLPPKANARSQSSGCQRATACLEGRVSQKHRSPGIDWLYEPIKQVFLKFTLR